jgi:hypothetical protein
MYTSVVVKGELGLARWLVRINDANAAGEAEPKSLSSPRAPLAMKEQFRKKVQSI